MTVYYYPNYSSDAFLNLKERGGIAYGAIVVDTKGLVELLELHLGIHHDPVSEIDRQAAWLKCMRSVMAEGHNCLSASWAKNVLGVSNQCLAWRDHLRMAGWNRDMEQPSERFCIIAKADTLFEMLSLGDRIITLIDSITRNPLGNDATIRVGTTSPRGIAPKVAELLVKLKSLGIRVSYTKDELLAPVGSNLYYAQQLLLFDQCSGSLSEEDGSLKIWHFPTATDASRYIALINKEEFDVYVSSDARLLDSTQRMLSQPTSGTVAQNDSPQIVQMFLLGMNLFEYPLNIRNLLDWMQMPIHPLKSALRHALVKAIVDTGGFDNERYREAITSYLDELDTDEDRLKTQQKLKIFDVRPTPEVQLDALRQFNNALGSWAAQRAAFPDLSESQRQQLAQVSDLCGILHDILQGIELPSIPYSRLEAAITTLYQSTDSRVYDPEAGSRHIVPCDQLIDDADSIIWTDCYNYSAANYPFDFLNRKELPSFTQQGCQFQSENDFNIEEIASLYAPILKARHRCVIVIVDNCGSAKTNEHPIVTRLRLGFPKSYKNLVEDPSIEKFEKRKIQPVNNLIGGAELNVNCELPMPDHESFSSLDLLIQYPLDYVMSSIAGIRNWSSVDLKEIATTKGNVAHKAIETIFHGTSEDIRKALADDFNTIFDKIVLEIGAILLLPENKLELEGFKAQLLECLQALLSIISENGLTVVAREWEINTHIGLLENGDPGMKGFVDMVLQDKHGALYVFDFKWSRSPKYYYKLLEQNLSLQLALYKEMLEVETGKKVAATAYFIMPKHKLYTVSQDLKGENVVNKSPANDNNLVSQAINSYQYRRKQLAEGIIEDGDSMPLDGLKYGIDMEEFNLFPLKVDDNTSTHSQNRFSDFSCFKYDTLV
ncbi:MAG: PD-(D/E)XK nuclease family protein [Bacteroidales bacterium]|nr:PD-(D/E)XK nuclease family protein [Bacteroidales bacterium]